MNLRRFFCTVLAAAVCLICFTGCRKFDSERDFLPPGAVADAGRHAYAYVDMSIYDDRVEKRLDGFITADGRGVVFCEDMLFSVSNCSGKGARWVHAKIMDVRLNPGEKCEFSMGRGEGEMEVACEAGDGKIQREIWQCRRFENKDAVLKKSRTQRFCTYRALILEQSRRF